MINKKIELNKKLGKEVARILGHFKQWPELYQGLKGTMVLTGNSIFTIAHGANKTITVNLKNRKMMNLMDEYLYKNKEFNRYFSKHLFTKLEGNIIEYEDGYDFFYRSNKNRDLIMFNLRDACDGLKAISQESATYRRCFFDLGSEELFIDRPDLFFNKQYTLIDDSKPDIDWDTAEICMGFRANYVP